MSALYYKAIRTFPLDESEKKLVQVILDKGLQNNEVCSLALQGGGELFSFYPSEIDTNCILQGSTSLPTDLFPDDIDDFIYVTEHWFDLLSEIRNKIPNSEWTVTLDDKSLFWNQEKLRYERPR